MPVATRLRESPHHKRAAMAVTCLAHAAAFWALTHQALLDTTGEPDRKHFERIQVELKSRPSMPDLLGQLPMQTFAASESMQVDAPSLPTALPKLAVARSPASESKHAPASSSAASNAALQAQPPVRAKGDVSCLPLAWLESMSVAISYGLRYPRYSRELRHRGTAQVRILVARDGRVLKTSLRRSTGHSLLDIEAREVARRIGHFPPVPANACPGAEILVVDQPIVFGRQA